MKTEGTIDAKDPSLYGREKDSYIRKNNKGGEGAWAHVGGACVPHFRG